MGISGPWNIHINKNVLKKKKNQHLKYKLFFPAEQTLFVLEIMLFRIGLKTETHIKYTCEFSEFQS